MNKTELVNKLAELAELGYSFIAIPNNFDEVCRNKGVVAILRSAPLPTYYDPNSLNSDAQLAHCATHELREDYSEQISPELTVLSFPDTALILAKSDDNTLIGRCQDTLDYTKKTGIVLKYAGLHRQERGNSELKSRISKLEQSHK